MRNIQQHSRGRRLLEAMLAIIRAADAERASAVAARVAEVGYRGRVYDAPPETFEEQFQRMKRYNERRNRDAGE